MSIRQVAARAGVSAATVSRVFTQPDAVAADTQRRVMAAAEELGYAPNPVARSLARGRTGNLGIVVPDIANSFAAVITKAVQSEALHDDFALFIAGSDHRPEEEYRLARAIASQVDGLLLITPGMAEEKVREVAASTPLAVFNREIDGCPATLVPGTEGATQAVEHLHALGHREIAYLAGPPVYSNAMRQVAFRAACDRLQITGVEIDLGDARFSAGVRAGDLVLAAGVSAVLAYNDEVAVGVLNRLAHRGVDVPREVSVIGFDDTGLAEMVIPLLTTVRLPAAAAGAAAVRMLLDVVNGRDGAGGARLHLSSELVIRSTTAPPAPARRPGGST
ncbi:MAG TPA: LacI family DNA-binding transcriptional regulator [Pseudonocardia sp.]|nr:LacI family DNA-binding transcriptional regulator [Pseudonocardia sp.]